MSKICEICGKKPMVGNNVSHAHNVTKRRFNPNLNPYHSTSTCQAKNGKIFWRFMAQKQQTGWG